MALNRRQLRALPKVELHRHLDGSIRPGTVLDIARRHNLDIDISNPDALKRRITLREPADLAAILAAFDTIQKATCSYEAIRRIAFENVEDCVLDGIVLAELRFSPGFIALNKSLNNDEIIEGVLDGVADGMERYDIQVGLIHIVSRTLDPAVNRRSTEDIIAYARRGQHRCADRIVGFDLADREALSEPEDFSDLVALARGADLGITVHSGEETGPDHV
ncbi:MAG: adenosine deaminase, partial [Gammaproteobacteria bacterium]|nr:adenosine deaminase [Gammaproteobacteria bacterium]